MVYALGRRVEAVVRGCFWQEKPLSPTEILGFRPGIAAQTLTAITIVLLNWQMNIVPYG